MHIEYSNIKQICYNDIIEYRKILDKYDFFINSFTFIIFTLIILLITTSKSNYNYIITYPSFVISLFTGINNIRLLKNIKYLNYKNHIHIFITILCHLGILFGTWVRITTYDSPTSSPSYASTFLIGFLLELSIYSQIIIIILFITSLTISLHTIIKEKKYLISYIVLTINYISIYVALLFSMYTDSSIKVEVMPTLLILIVLPIIIYGIIAIKKLSKR